MIGHYVHVLFAVVVPFDGTQSAERIATVTQEIRAVTVAAESRVVIVAAENRIVNVAADGRSTGVQGS